MPFSRVLRSPGLVHTSCANARAPRERNLRRKLRTPLDDARTSLAGRVSVVSKRSGRLSLRTLPTTPQDSQRRRPLLHRRHRPPPSSLARTAHGVPHDVRHPRRRTHFCRLSAIRGGEHRPRAAPSPARRPAQHRGRAADAAPDGRSRDAFLSSRRKSAGSGGTAFVPRARPGVPPRVPGRSRAPAAPRAAPPPTPRPPDAFLSSRALLERKAPARRDVRQQLRAALAGRTDTRASGAAAADTLASRNDPLDGRGRAPLGPRGRDAHGAARAACAPDGVLASRRTLARPPGDVDGFALRMHARTRGARNFVSAVWAWVVGVRRAVPGPWKRCATRREGRVGGGDDVEGLAFAAGRMDVASAIPPPSATMGCRRLCAGPAASTPRTDASTAADPLPPIARGHPTPPAAGRSKRASPTAAAAARTWNPAARGHRVGDGSPSRTRTPRRASSPRPRARPPALCRTDAPRAWTVRLPPSRPSSLPPAACPALQPSLLVLRPGQRATRRCKSVRTAVRADST
ncbi:hypothetical protein PsYK624_111860 [Phanerochaete sordida]|uniref:Uncharacterized protein n=1 Tax=Phanerochaete sordida TaxID=48140 RepID=A0A9P3LHI4_9APHY|nr:hypothetical protein PsYK624_111860 [Phanerochaete sordida]